jgi:hypothetical protein
MNRNRFADTNVSVKDPRRIWVELGQVWMPKTKESHPIYIEGVARGSEDLYTAYSLGRIHSLMLEEEHKIKSNRFVGVEVRQDLSPINSGNVDKWQRLDALVRGGQIFYPLAVDALLLQREHIIQNYTLSKFLRDSIAWERI